MSLFHNLKDRYGEDTAFNWVDVLVKKTSKLKNTFPELDEEKYIKTLFKELISNANIPKYSPTYILAEKIFKNYIKGNKKPYKKWQEINEK